MAFQIPSSQPSVDLNELMNRAKSGYQSYSSSSQESIMARHTPPVDYPCNEPSRFDGSKNNVKKYISQLKLYFGAKRKTFESDLPKVYFAISLLEKEAFEWIHPFIERIEETFPTLEMFISELTKQFGDTNSVEAAEKSLFTLRQTSSVSEYSSRFRIIQSQIDWNESALCCHFYRGLKDRIKDELAKISRPDTLKELIELSIRLDNRIQERFIEKKIDHSNSQYYSRPPFRTSEPSASTPAPVRDPDAMEIDVLSKTRRGPLSKEEKARRRRLNLCLYCGDAGHTVSHCPSISRPALSVVNSIYNPRPFVVAVMLYNTVPLQTYALIDSGASFSFIDRDFVRKNKIALIEKETPYTISAVDGRPVDTGVIKEETTSLRLSISDHSENVVFDVTAIKTYPIILGMDWLIKHDPSISWKSKTLSFGSCPETCAGSTPITTTSMCDTILDCQEDTRLLKDIQRELKKSANETLDIAAPQLCNVIEHPVDTSATNLVPAEYFEFADLFDAPCDASALPEHTKFDHGIDLVPNSEPPFGPIYPLAAKEQEALRAQLDLDLKRNFIQPSKSPYGAPVLFADKKGDAKRMVLDYRLLNKITIKSKYPLPLISEILDQLRKARIFTALDLRGAYNLLRIREGDEEKTAFRTKYGSFEYKVMPFGLTNAPASFQKFMNAIFSDFIDVFVVVYLDDILVYSEDISQHQNHVISVLQRLKQHNLYLSPEKCIFSVEKIPFLGFIIAHGTVSMNPEKVSCLSKFSAPTTVKHVQEFLGFCNFYRRFIPGYARITAPLSNLLKKMFYLLLALLSFSRSRRSSQNFLKCLR